MNRVAKTKTVVTGLKGIVQRPADVGRLTNLVADVSEIRFHAFGVLNFRYVYTHGVMPEPFRRGVVLDKPVSLDFKWRKNNNKFLRWREPPISADPAV